MFGSITLSGIVCGGLLVACLMLLFLYLGERKSNRCRSGERDEKLAPPQQEPNSEVLSSPESNIQPHPTAEVSPPAPEPDVPQALTAETPDFPEELTLTTEFLQVREAIKEKQPFILVTGGAGTGKTTLIHWLSRKEPNHVILAFTGSAALVCRGSTLHSFFRFPLGVLLDDTWKPNLTEKFVSICRHLDLIIIDEISMVRADLMDAVDRRLREALNTDKAFGGITVLMVGDPCQLPPIVTQEEATFFASASGGMGEDRWKSPWFFHARVFGNKRFCHIKLTHVFRQQEDMRDYIGHLNHLRTQSVQGSDIRSSLRYFNEHCHGEDGLFDEGAITITFTRAEAQHINDANLSKLPSALRCYDAMATGVFAKAGNGNLHPADSTLKLKVGAQIIMLANDEQKRYVNGSLGIVRELAANHITVKLRNGYTCEVERNCWISYDYVYDDLIGRIVQQENGRFTQFPLAAAWAFTAHKSQGKTLDRVNIILQRNAFAAGQTYVALSRTRRIDDLRFSAPLAHYHFRADSSLRELADFCQPYPPDPDDEDHELFSSAEIADRADVEE